MKKRSFLECFGKTDISDDFRDSVARYQIWGMEGGVRGAKGRARAPEMGGNRGFGREFKNRKFRSLGQSGCDLEQEEILRKASMIEDQETEDEEGLSYLDLDETAQIGTRTKTSIFNLNDDFEQGEVKKGVFWGLSVPEKVKKGLKNGRFDKKYLEDYAEFWNNKKMLKAKKKSLEALKDTSNHLWGSKRPKNTKTEPTPGQPIEGINHPNSARVRHQAPLNSQNIDPMPQEPQKTHPPAQPQPTSKQQKFNKLREIKSEYINYLAKNLPKTTTEATTHPQSAQNPQSLQLNLLNTTTNELIKKIYELDQSSRSKLKGENLILKKAFKIQSRLIKTKDEQKSKIEQENALLKQKIVEIEKERELVYRKMLEKMNGGREDDDDEDDDSNDFGGGGMGYGDRGMFMHNGGMSWNRNIDSF